MLLIDQQEKFNHLCDSLIKEPVLCMDTEFCRRHSYYPKLSLIQIATAHEEFIIDALMIKDFSHLKPIICSETICKVMHASDQDLEIFFYLFKKVAVNVFDTQIAAGVAGFSSIMGYSSLCKEILDIKIDKTLQKADWLIRPLSKASLQYAANDVKYLVPIYRQLKATLDSRKLWNAYNQRSKKLLSHDTYKFSPDKFLVQAQLHGAPEQLKTIYTTLLVFREECAQILDIPRTHCASAEDLLTLASALPTNDHELFKSRLTHLAITRNKFKKKLFDLCLGLKELSQ